MLGSWLNKALLRETNPLISLISGGYVGGYDIGGMLGYLLNTQLLLFPANKRSEIQHGSFLVLVKKESSTKSMGNFP